MPVAGGVPVRSTVSPDVAERMDEAGVKLGRFVWSPSGSALFF